jgi:hypothetical protein
VKEPDQSCDYVFALIIEKGEREGRFAGSDEERFC